MVGRLVIPTRSMVMAPRDQEESLSQSMLSVSGGFNVLVFRWGLAAPLDTLAS